MILNMKAEASGKIAALAALIPALSAEDEPARREALRSAVVWAKSFRKWYEIKDALKLLAPHLPSTLLKEALAKAQAIGDSDADRQVYGMDVFIPLLPEAAREDALRFVLKTIVGWEPWARARALAEWRKNCRGIWRKTLWRRPEESRSPTKSKALTGLATILDGDEREQVLGEAKTAAALIEDAQYHADALAMIVEAIQPEKRGPIIEEGMALVEQVEDANLYAAALVRFTPFLDEQERDRILEEAYEKRRSAKHRNEAIKILAPHLPEKVARLAFRRVQFYDSYDQGEMLPALGLRLIEFGEYDSVYRAFMGMESRKIEALTALARKLPQGMLARALADARGIDSSRREEVLSALSVRLAEIAGRDEALKVARELESPVRRAEAFAGVAPHLEGEEREGALRAALEATLQIEGVNERGHSLKELAPRLARSDKNSLYKMFCSVLASLSTKTRFHAVPELYMFSPVIAALGGAEAVGESWRAIRDVYRWWF